MKIKFCLIIACLFSCCYIHAQSWNYKFSKAKDTLTSLDAFTADTSVFPQIPAGGGIYGVRIGSGGGQLILKKGNNKGELQLGASQNNFTNKFTVSNWNNASASFYLKCRIKTSAPGSASFIIAIGKSTPNTIFKNDYCHTGGYGCSLAMLRISYSRDGTISLVDRRDKDVFTAIPNSQLLANTYQDVEFYVNNTNGTTDYTHGDIYSLRKQSWDVWVNGVKISPQGGFKKSASESNISLEPNDLINGFAFFAENNQFNDASLFLDEITYSNNFPVVESLIAVANKKDIANYSFVSSKK